MASNQGTGVIITWSGGTIQCLDGETRTGESPRTRKADLGCCRETIARRREGTQEPEGECGSKKCSPSVSPTIQQTFPKRESGLKRREGESKITLTVRGGAQREGKAGKGGIPSSLAVVRRRTE